MYAALPYCRTSSPQLLLLPSACLTSCQLDQLKRRRLRTFCAADPDRAVGGADAALSRAVDLPPTACTAGSCFSPALPPAEQSRGSSGRKAQRRPDEDQPSLMLEHAAAPADPSAAAIVCTIVLLKKEEKSQRLRCCIEQEGAEEVTGTAAGSGARRSRCCDTTRKEGRERPTDSKDRGGVGAV